jgi:ABC-type antimicrobial peptide transport system permease subunit
MGFNPIVYPEWDAALVLNIALLVVATGVLASLYPAWKALKLKPSEAVRAI